MNLQISLAQQKCAKKLTLVFPGGQLVCWGALTNFPCKLHLKNFHRPGGADAPTAPAGYAYDSRGNNRFYRLFFMLHPVDVRVNLCDRSVMTHHS